MSDNDEALLDSVDDIEDDNYDIGNEEEEALLEDNYSDFKPSRSHTNVRQAEETEDVLDLDDDVELGNDDEVEDNLKRTSGTNDSLIESSDSKERECKFTNERQLSVPNNGDISNDTVQINKNKNKFNNRATKGGNAFRGRITKGSLYTRQKTVHINPHFQGNVQVKNNTRLAWDSSRQGLGNKKSHSRYNASQQQPVACIHPWSIGKDPIQSQNSSNFNFQQSYQQPTTSTFSYQIPIMQVSPQVPFNQFPLQYSSVHQRLGYNNSQSSRQVFSHPLNDPFNNQPYQFNSSIPPYSEQNGVPNPSIPFPNPQYPPPQNINFNSFNTPPPTEPVYQNHQVVPQVNHLVYNQSFNNSLSLYNQPPPASHIINTNISFTQPKNIFRKNDRFSHQPHHQRFKQQKTANLLPNRSNLHEVTTVESPDTTMEIEIVATDNDDEDTKAYRKKIEEQKKLREKILQQKEERRKQAASKCGEIQNVPTPSELFNEADNVRNAKNISDPKLLQTKKGPVNVKKLHFKKSQQIKNNNIRSGNVSQQNIPQCLISVKNQPSNNLNVSNDKEKEHLTSFLANRRVLAKDQSLVDSSIVVISNLSSGTSDVVLRKMCQGIGDIERLQMSTKERQATIQFKSVASAHAFFKKYQRTMLDLSVIQVALKTMTQTIIP